MSPDYNPQQNRSSFSEESPLIVGMGELLIDRFPDQQRPGGAPANVAYNLSRLGNRVELVSSVGDDADGDHLLQFMEMHDVSTSYIQQSSHPTGIVDIRFRDNGDAEYNIVKPSAWDDIRWNDDIDYLATIADAACFSTLAQREPTSREAIQIFLKSMPSDALKILDLNLRPPHYSPTIIRESLELADILKVNRDEYDTLANLFPSDDLPATLIETFGLQCIIVTLGKEGSRYLSANDRFFVPALEIDTSSGDSVGVGDAFIATVIHHQLRGTPPETTIDFANRYAALVASRRGAMVPLEDHLIEFFR